MIRNVFITVVALALAVPSFAGQQRQADATVWRTLAESVAPGTAVRVQLTDGQRFTAVLVEAQADAVLLQPKARMAVPVQPVRYADIASMERVLSGGLSAGKVAAIAAGTGAAAFFGIFLAFMAAYSD